MWVVTFRCARFLNKRLWALVLAALDFSFDAALKIRRVVMFIGWHRVDFGYTFVLMSGATNCQHSDRLLKEVTGG